MFPTLLSRSCCRGSTDSLTTANLPKVAEARLRLGLSIAEVCRRAHISPDNYVKYERETVEPQYMSLETLQKLSEVLQIDLFSDYHRFKQNSVELVKAYMKKHGVTNREFAEICGVSVTTVKNWRNGTCSPSYELWEKIFKQ